MKYLAIAKTLMLAALAGLALSAAAPVQAAGLLDKTSSSRIDRQSSDQIDAAELLKQARDLRVMAIDEMKMAKERARMMWELDPTPQTEAAAILLLDQSRVRSARLEEQARALEHQAEAHAGQELEKLCRDERKGRTTVVGYCDRFNDLQGRASSSRNY